MENELQHLQQYKIEVEEKLNWGSSREWRNQDFQKLSERIYEETGELLSSTTLKRIWGKLKYESVPNTHTLDTLAQFIGHENWLAFKNRLSTINNNRSFTPSKFFKPALWASLLLIVVLLSIGFIFKNRFLLPPEISDQIVFTSEPVTEGIPNTVVFKYDLSAVSSDNIMIQQNWDPKRRFKIPKDSKAASSIYYLPGYWKAKLVIDDQVVKEHDLYIRSNGWLISIDREPQPRYFLKAEWVEADYFGIKSEVLEDIYSTSDSPEWMSFHYVEDFGDLHSDNFTLETSFRNTYLKGDGICREVRIVLLCTDGIMVIPFAIPGCVGDLRLRFNDIVQDGKSQDLSAFGCDFSNWQHLKCEVKDRQVRLFLNGNLIHELSYLESAGKIAGIRFRFRGAGTVKDTQFWNGKGELVFDSC